jgi:hypothetical protein
VVVVVSLNQSNKQMPIRLIDDDLDGCRVDRCMVFGIDCNEIGKRVNRRAVWYHYHIDSTEINRG